MSDDDGDRSFLELDPETAWLETEAISGFRVWHIIAICLGILLTLVVMVCCCIRFRIPRTKQEIEADYQRKQITKKFREKLQQIKNSDMDDMDLQKAADACYDCNENNNIYTDKSALITQAHHHLAWQEHKHSIVSLSIVEAGCVALHHVTEDVISLRSGRYDVLKNIGLENHIVHPAAATTTTYRYNQNSKYLMVNPMVHRATPASGRLHDNYYKANGPRRYQYTPEEYEDFDRADNSIAFANAEKKKILITQLEDEHPAYGCNL